MSLTSEVFLVGEGAELDILAGQRDGRPDGMELAGPESWRRTVWGSRAIRRLGARFLPASVSVHNGDVVAPDEIPAFLAEIDRVRAYSERLTAETRPSDRTVESHHLHVARRLHGIEASARYAQGAGGGLLIWYAV
ncbi:hypothetical protein [Streptomyces rishiriensis]|uniref:Uncharacterized protein n=1 Tax=Streptomyces rishiriensis TaxID=68264 RepID=A0ABU0NY75_STRRH|nr:hypothetical protein [Streptomyces rishiriensis]MDQ0584087.1 hypothetical protein [Streptomyces rishiriensis]